MKVLFNSFLIYTLIVNIAYSQTGWVNQNSYTDNRLNEVFFIDENTGWISADSTKILKTTNSGLTWTVQSLPYSSPLRTIYFINENTGWAGGGYYYFLQNGVMLKTTNGGDTWFSLQFYGNVQDLYFIDENTGFAGTDGSGDFGSGGNLLRTTNGGLNWTDINANYIFPGISFKDAETGYAIGHYWDDTGNDTGFVYRTTNTGETWEIKYKERNLQFYYGSLRDIFTEGENVWVCGNDSSILYSSNNGDNWTRQYIPVPGIKYSVFFIDNNTGWSVGLGSDTTKIIKTTNGGMNWFNQKSYNSSWLNSVMFVNANTGWSVGDYGTILKTTTGGLTFINNNYTQTPSIFSLEQNYPNPFNLLTVIRYSLKENQNTTLKVFDALGRDIATLVDEKQSAGSYSVDFDGSNLASGIYYYQLTSGEYRETKRMILIK